MQENKSIVQEALIQMKQVEEAIAENAKGILASTMKEEISQLVKESLSEQDDEDGIELDADIDDIDADADNEEDTDMDFDLDVDSDDEEPIDLTDASDEEILKVFKAMGEEDGIIVKKDGDEISLKDNNSDAEYLVKLGESEEDENFDTMNELEEENDVDTDEIINAIFSKGGKHSDHDEDEDEDEDEEDEVLYEIEFDDEEGDEEEMDEQWQAVVEPIVVDLATGYAADKISDMFSEDEEEMMEQDDDDDEDDEDEDIDESYNPNKSIREGASTIKPKGVGLGSGPKFTYKAKTTGGFKEDKKEGSKTFGTGKAKFTYKAGGNANAKSKTVVKKAETKEGQGYDDREDEKLSAKHGKIARKDVKTTKARRDDAGFEKGETKEAVRTLGMGSKEGRGLRKGITPNRNYVYTKNAGVKVESLENEVNVLREKNEEYRKALNVFRDKLNEVAIFNSNLAYATRLFTEHSTTKKEKINILRRFDDVESLKESKNLYRNIKEELIKPEGKSINEAVETKINKTVSTGSSTTLIESKTYENPQFLRMKDLMSKLK
jgi:hypothetical protein